MASARVADAARAPTHQPKTLCVLRLDVSKQQPRPFSPGRTEAALVQHSHMHSAVVCDIDELLRLEGETAVWVLVNLAPVLLRG